MPELASPIRERRRSLSRSEIATSRRFRNRTQVVGRDHRRSIHRADSSVNANVLSPAKDSAERSSHLAAQQSDLVANSIIRSSILSSLLLYRQVTNIFKCGILGYYHTIQANTGHSPRLNGAHARIPCFCAIQLRKSPNPCLFSADPLVGESLPPPPQKAHALP